MRRPPLKPNKEVTIQDLYPELNEEEQEEAEHYLKRYLAVIRQIYERTHGLTAPGAPGTLPSKEGESSLKSEH
jgi:hypothetical protein